MQVPDIHRSWRERLAMTTVFVANGLGFGTWAANIPRLRETLALDSRSLGLVLLCVSLGAIGAMQLTGRYASRVGTARASLLSAFGVAIILLLPGAAGSWAALMASGFLLGITLGGLDACMNAHAAWMERRWGAAIMSSFHAGWSVGQLAGAALAGLLAGLGLSLFGSMALAAGLVAILGASALWLPEAREGPAETSAGFTGPSRGVLVLCALIALSFAIEGAAADWSGVYLRTVLDVPEALASTSLASFAGAMVVMRLVGDRLVRALGPVRTVCWGGVAAAAGMLGVVLAPGALVASLSFGLVGAGVANIVPVVFTVAGRGGTARVSMVAGAGYGAMMVAPPIVGFVADGFGLRIALLLVVIGSLVIGLLGRKVTSDNPQHHDVARPAASTTKLR